MYMHPVRIIEAFDADIDQFAYVSSVFEMSPFWGIDLNPTGGKCGVGSSCRRETAKERDTRIVNLMRSLCISIRSSTLVCIVSA